MRLKTLALAISVVVLASLPVWVGGQGYSRASNYSYWVDPGACNGSTAGTRKTGSGLVVAGASATPVVAIVADPAGEGTTTATIICTITPPSWIVTTGTGLAVQDAVFMFTPETTMGTSSSVAGSGTLNGSTVFGSITYPTPATGETATTVTPARADSGNLTILPAAASIPITTTTAGSFYSLKFTPATPIVWKTDLKQLLLTVTLPTIAGLQTQVDSSGVLVHFKSQ